MPTAVNERMTRVPQPGTVALADRVRRLRAAGRRIIALQTGDPDFSTPPAIIAGAHRALRDGLTHYGHSRGLPELRIAIADKLQRVNGVACDPETEILVTCGAVHAYYCGLQAIISPGDEVLVPDPTWMTHTNMVWVVGGRPIRVPSRAEEGFWPTLDAWERAVTPRTRGLVINSPNNPTGMVATAEYLAELNGLAERHDLYVLSDEVYENILYANHQHTCFATLPGARERTLLINSLSKTYAMTGWRVGYLVAPAPVLDLALKASQHSITNLAPFVQKAATFALTDAGMQEEARRMAAAYAGRREAVLRLAREYASSRVELPPPQGAFYFFVDVRQLGLASVEASERLLEEASLALVPGSVFGQCGEGFLRMTTAAATEEIEIGVRALFDWASHA